MRSIFSRIRLLVSFGRVLKANHSTALSTFELEGFLGELRSGVPRVGHYGFQADPPVGAQALALAVGGDRGNLVIAGIEDRYTRPTLGARETQVYTKAGPILRGITDTAGSANTTSVDGTTITVGHVTNSNLAELRGKAVTIWGGTSGVTIFTGADVSVTSTGGDVSLSASGNVDISAPTVTINGVNFSTHTHTIPAGTDASGGVSGVPQ